MADLSGFKNQYSGNPKLETVKENQELLEAEKEDQELELVEAEKGDQELEDQEPPEAVKTDEELLEELREAVVNNQDDQVTRLLGMGVDPNQRDKCEKLPILSWATSEAVATQLIDKGANIDLRDDQPHGWTALHWAVRREMPDVVKLLARRGAKQLPALNSHHHTPLQWLTRAKDSGGTKCESDSERLRMKCEMLKYMLTGYPDSERLRMIEEQDPEGFTLLTTAAHCGVEPIVRELLELGAKVNQRNVFFETALHRACRCGHSPVLIALLEKGANIDSLDGLQQTPLMQAVQSGNLDCAVQLIDRGANVSQKDFSGRSLQALAVLSGSLEMRTYVQGIRGLCHERDTSGRTQLHFACQSGNPHMVMEFLKNGYTPEVDEHGRNALIHATIGPKANLEVISLLLERGVRDLPDKDGWTALRWAAEAGKSEIYTRIRNARSDEAQHDIVSWDEIPATECDNCLLYVRLHQAFYHYRGHNYDLCVKCFRRILHTPQMCEVWEEKEGEERLENGKLGKTSLVRNRLGVKMYSHDDSEENTLEVAYDNDPPLLYKR